MQSASLRAALDRAHALLESLRGRTLTRGERADHAERLAADLLTASLELASRADRHHAALLGRMMGDPRGQAFTTALSDRLHRSRDAGRVAEQLAYLVKSLGAPRYLSAWERTLLATARRAAPVAPGLVARGSRARLRAETRRVLLSAEEPDLSGYLRARHQQHAQINVNQLGEALLGEAAAEARVAKYVELARRPDIDALSVKVSSIGSQLQLLAFDATTAQLAARLRRIYAATLARPEAERPVVVLDMEAYRHAELTFAVMREALSEPALDRVRAGLVLQAYLPDANAWLRDVMAWARARSERGGISTRVRIVKGANLAHERVEAQKAGFGLPMFRSKREVDANYKRLLERAIDSHAAPSLQLGVASHNLFDIAYALVLAREREVVSQVGIEVLEGMADPVRLALSALGCQVLVYAPICNEDDWNTGIAYLVRRLDENTSSENFLSASFTMRPHDASFERERARFRAALELVDGLSESPRRAPESSFDRALPAHPSQREFHNEADTDFASHANRAWVQAALEARLHAHAPVITSVIAGRPDAGGALRAGEDPSRPGAVPYQIALADRASVERALACAASDPAHFSRTTPEQRANLLRRVAQALRRARGELIAWMVLDGGKRVTEADAEVSEAIDFAEYYRESFLRLVREQPATFAPRGTVVVTPPWNFPLAIPAGGVLAGLMAGNRVILKPALETAGIAERMVQLFHAAGIPRSALQLVVCEDEVGSTLIRDVRVDSVILTGATDTARLFRQLRPGLHLLAETGGKNAYIITAMSDRDQAIADVVHSAYGHAGQKCSAASLLILEAEVHDDPAFLDTLADAVRSLHVGSAWDPRSVVTPLIQPPRGALLRSVEQLEPGERWLVAPQVQPGNPRLLSPGVKLGVAPGSFMHTTELFGPVLAVMRARDLDHAIELANATGYGLTAGLASLDERAQAHFIDRIAAGNVYVNRGITGAIVERQPFGGFGKSGFGPGAKAGGPNYVAQLCRISDATDAPPRSPTTPLPASIATRLEAFCRALSASDANTLRARVTDYARAFAEHFAQAQDRQRILGQHNLLRYLPCPGVLLRVERDARLVDVAASCLAASIAGARLTISLHPQFSAPLDATLCGHPVQVQLLSTCTPQDSPPRMRLLGARTAEHDSFSARHGTHIADAPVLNCGRFELLHYLREQSVSIEYHRYGQLGWAEMQRGS